LVTQRRIPFRTKTFGGFLDGERKKWHLNSYLTQELQKNYKIQNETVKTKL
jgi:hypothetical protein